MLQNKLHLIFSTFPTLARLLQEHDTTS